MREISNALSDAIFAVCNKAISNAKFDKTYRCRIVEKIADGKYTITKDNVEHTVSGAGTYEPDEFVYVLLPLNNWKDAIIISR